MDRPHWSLQDAKNSFSAVVDAAVKGRPQTVTKRGKPAVVVVSIVEYDRLCRRQTAENHDAVRIHCTSVSNTGTTCALSTIPLQSMTWELHQIHERDPHVPFRHMCCQEIVPR